MSDESPYPISTERLQEAAARAAAELDLRLVALFGSAARLEDSPQDVDVIDLGGASPVLLMQVARDGVPLFQRDASESNAFYSPAARRFADTRKFREAERAVIRDFVAREVEGQ